MKRKREERTENKENPSTTEDVKGMGPKKANDKLALELGFARAISEGADWCAAGSL